MKKNTLIRFYLIAAGLLLILTSAAKIVSAFGVGRILQLPDPIFGIAYKYLFITVGALEFIVALICLFSKNTLLNSKLLAWLATNILLYRFGLLWVGYRKPCSCLGSLTGALHLSDHSAEMIMEIILLYLLVGSYTILVLLRRGNSKECKKQLGVPRSVR